MTKHKSTTYVQAFAQRGNRWKMDPITDQVRMVIRLAVACHAAGTDYDVAWELDPIGVRPSNQFRMKAVITAQGNIPMPKKLTAPAALKLVSAKWTPKSWEAEYRLDAHHIGQKLTPAMVIPHSCGLGLVMPCETGEWGTEAGDANPNGKWRVTHLASGKGFGLELPLNKAAEAVLFAAAQPIDWNVSLEALSSTPNFRHVGLTVQAAYGAKDQRIEAEERLANLETSYKVAA